MSLNTLFVSIGAGFVYNTIATYMNNMIFETAGINEKTTMFDTKFMCPIAEATELESLDIKTDSKWDILFGNPNYRVWCFPTFTPRKIIIHNIDEYARENKLFVAADIRVPFRLNIRS